jgi:mannose-6-phosphate isomerase
MAALFDSFDDFHKRMRGVILPFWATSGFITRLGQFHERAALSGELVEDAPLRAMVQARQIYVYTNAERTGEMKGSGEKALQALDALLTRYAEDRDLKRGLAFSISPAGDVVSDVRDSYAHAFALFALASAFRLTGDRKLFGAVEALMAFIDDKLWDHQAGGLFDRYPEPGVTKLQNPLMHMLEAYLALHEAWPDGGFLDRAGDIVRLFRERLFRPELGVILEKYRADWSTELAPETFFEPGHQFEWAWLLAWYDNLAGTDHGQFRQELWRSACRVGIAPGVPCPDEIASNPGLSKRTSRVWPHAEGIKAAMVRYEAGDAGAAEVASGLLAPLNSFFLGTPFPAGWMDRVAANGDPLAEMVPASTLYHLYSAFKETTRVVTRDTFSPGLKRVERAEHQSGALE